MRTIVLGYIVRGPLGGLAWHHLRYVMGFARLGHDVFFMEDIDDYASCYDPHEVRDGHGPVVRLAFRCECVRSRRFARPVSLFRRAYPVVDGRGASRAIQPCRDADLLIDVSGVNPIREWHGGIPLRVLIDTDPAFTRIRHLVDSAARERAGQHSAFFSFA